MPRELNLDQATPAGVADVLRNAATEFRRVYADLADAWGDPSGGGHWREVANILEMAANYIEKLGRS
jgi:hypothetical protein